MAAVRLSYTPAEVAATVTAARVYDDPARVTPVASGVPVLLSGVWTFTPDLSDGDYYTAWDVTDSTGSFTDGDDFFYVQFGEVVPNSKVVSMDVLRSRTDAPEEDEDKLLSFLGAAVDVVADYIGSPLVPTPVTETHSSRGTIILNSTRARSLTSVTSGGSALTGYTLSPGGLVTGNYYGYGYGFGGSVTVTYVAGFERLPAAVREAVIYTVQHAYESERGAVPVSFQAGADESFTVSRGFFMPNRSKELLEPYRRMTGVA